MVGREWALRQQARTVGEAARVARLSGDVDNAPILIGQDAGLIDAVLPAAEVIQRMVAQAEEIITGRLRPMLRAYAAPGAAHGSMPRSLAPGSRCCDGFKRCYKWATDCR